MATYKRRGYKPNTKKEEEALIEDGSTTAEVFNTLDEGAHKTEAWLEKNQKKILTVIGIIAAVVLIVLLYQNFIHKPKEKDAMNDMFQAQLYFEKAVDGEDAEENFRLALNGADGKFGFLDIIHNYKSTKAGNLANYYAGISYLHTKDYKNAISYLDNFKSKDELLAPLATGAIGDAFAQLEQYKEAFDYYEKAANMRDNEITTPIYLLKAGVTALELDKINLAKKYLEKLTEQYPETEEATKALTYLGTTQVLN